MNIFKIKIKGQGTSKDISNALINLAMQISKEDKKGEMPEVFKSVNKILSAHMRNEDK